MPEINHADVPSSLGVTAPILAHLNPQGKWEKSSPGGIDEAKLQQIVKHLYDTQAVEAARSYCSQYHDEIKGTAESEKKKFVPVIFMPILPNNCPFNIDDVAQEKDDKKKTKAKNEEAGDNPEKDSDKEREAKQKKRGYYLQRLTDFDLLSQW